MVCTHRSYRDLGLGTSSSHSHTTPVVVGAGVRWESLGSAWRDSGQHWQGLWTLEAGRTYCSGLGS